MSVNVDGVVLGARSVVPALAEGGAIVATASAAGLVGYPGDIPYSMTKHAVVGLVRGLAPLLDAAGPGRARVRDLPGRRADRASCRRRFAGDADDGPVRDRGRDRRALGRG